jgi:hypothetical protein
VGCAALHPSDPVRSNSMTAFATLTLGIGIFALFFGLVAACDQL